MATKKRYEVRPEVASRLATLRRVPDDVILSAATREFDMWAGDTCVCGWVVREALGRLNGTDAAQQDVFFSHHVAQQQFGGTREEWGRIYGSVTYPSGLAAVEEAFTLRVMEAARV